MTYEYKNLPTCSLHGLVLSPEGSCVRCRSESGERERRSLHVRLALALGVLTSLLAGSAVFAHVRVAETTLPVSRGSPMPTVTPGLEVFQEHVPRVTSPETHAALKQWKAELAKAKARESAERAKEARDHRAAEARDIRGEREAERIVAAAEWEEARAHARRTGGVPAPSSHDHPSWWQGDPFIGRRACPIAQRRAAMAAAAALPRAMANPATSPSFPETSF